MNHKGIKAFPDRIGRLAEVAQDLTWSWCRTAREAFRRMDYPLWRDTSHNPFRMLSRIAEDRIEWAARDPGFLELYDRAVAAMDCLRASDGSWWAANYGDLKDFSVAYFSAEFGIHQSLPIYAGGLGVLAGDHAKAACDLGIPLIGVGFMYPMGYFHQKIDETGWQVEIYERLAVEDVAVERVMGSDGTPCQVQVPVGHGVVWVAVWRVRVGCVTLLLLDTDVPQNSPWDRELSSRLYVSEHEARLRQEIVLGVAGVRILRALGLNPVIWHLNEGHAALVIFERLREMAEQGESLVSALRKVRSTTVFTTHTPVSAGHDAFQFHLVDHLLSGYWETAGERRNTLLALASYGDGHSRMFNMTALALRGAEGVNAVSRQHRDVTQTMFGPIWSGAHDEVPVRAVTNGVHLETWLAAPLVELYDQYLGDGWQERQDEPALWDRIQSIPDEELWKVRLALKDNLLSFIRDRARQRWTSEKVNACQVVAAGTLLDLSAPLICFARRFTQYKRPWLIFHDPARLARLLNDPRHPAQIIFAGKAHPADEPGKHSLQDIYRRAMDVRYAGRIAFIDDYDLHVAHYLVQGADVWLNNPLKPLEACGTSGMKAAVNGVPHLSVADGWWPEAYSGRNGWLIDAGPGADDAADADALYGLLEREVIPAYYDRNEYGVPARWLAVVKESIRTIAPRFCARRMVKQYAQDFYVPMTRRLHADGVRGHEP